MSFQNALVPSDAVAVTPGNNAQIGLVGLYVGGTGDVTLVTSAGSQVLFSAVPAGTTIQLLIAQVKATGTTATLLTGLKA